MIAAIFDLDGTLCDGHVLRGITHHHRAHRTRRVPLYFYWATHMALWPLWRSRLLSEGKVRETWTRHLGWTVAGWSEERAAVAFAWIAEQYVLPRVRPDVLARAGDHQARGHRVILVSGTLTPLLAEIGRQLDIPETVGTPLVLKNGRYTGASELPVCIGQGKVFRLQTHLGDDAIDWRHSFSYADSITDLPLLELAGSPVAVYPDAELAALARERNWDVID